MTHTEYIDIYAAPGEIKLFFSVLPKTPNTQDNAFNG